ncbi:MAG: hypothetical protein JWR90_1569 [Marmoricola sp.]|nr:hypothetical protein [Marmoricola sp.]
MTRYDEKAAARDLAVHLTMQIEHLMSHTTREGVGGSRAERGVKHHLTRLGLLNTVGVNGMTVTGPGHTAVDLGREHGFDTGVIACDHVLHAGRKSGLVKDDLRAVAATMCCWPGITATPGVVN